MTLYPVETGNFKLDGGAMFGVVPKTIWSRTNPADGNNLIDIAARSLLIEDGDRLILIDTGIGNKQSDKFFSYYHQWGNHNLDNSLEKLGFHKDDITDVFMTHLHFDHCGGSVQWNKNKTGYEPAFKNAAFWTNEDHWRWATEPNPREKASFLKENLLPMEAAGQLKFISRPTPLDGQSFVKNSELGFDILCIDGHTEKQMIPHINYKGKTLVFMADLMPTVGHIPLPYVTGYDTRPLLSMDEKATFSKQAVEKDFVLFFEHDAHNELCTLKNTEKGVRLNELFSFKEIFH
ncbi:MULTISPECIES: MBL fold metallo-hydrolase [Croceitalea]|uniref:MBL fold metallo-hydrolase n=1 Tax=Croceitalea vernalis TaxID=3075599 RepID=A0ABU3BDR1_9FLAO|nr:MULTISPECIES: MBL fold metallo-hydrolase [unclassified Croceitalea]MDT0538661.1 MBL fold metallo-hydrolase [Croceitalea sp. P059]MDT0620445.1 MBL fold metallo-hydrolase [Croceitalea sp. P007]